MELLTHALLFCVGCVQLGLVIHLQARALQLLSRADALLTASQRLLCFGHLQPCRLQLRLKLLTHGLERVALPLDGSPLILHQALLLLPLVVHLLQLVPALHLCSQGRLQHLLCFLACSLLRLEVLLDAQDHVLQLLTRTRLQLQLLLVLLPLLRHELLHGRLVCLVGHVIQGRCCATRTHSIISCTHCFPSASHKTRLKAVLCTRHATLVCAVHHVIGRRVSGLHPIGVRGVLRVGIVIPICGGEACSRVAPIAATLWHCALHWRPVRT
mmetsp:Transcript_16599/g.45586  ORF Transcript_16599/g.45586 Transcript_16599/m.45586 type:complete len:270 (-) Transcript_16599:266-1075(-)